MSAVQGIVEHRRDQIIEESTREHRQLVLTHRTEQGWKTFKAEFASGSKMDGELLATIQVPADEAVEFLPQAESVVGVTFRVGHRKCMFSSPVREIRRQNDTIRIRLNWPDHLQQLQRRAYERSSPSRGHVIAVRFWTEDDADMSAGRERAVKYGQLEDISAGGMRIKVADATDVVLGSTYRCAFTPRQGAPAFLLDATLRHREAGEQSRVSLGFQFLGLETTADGRKMLDRLARLVTQLHRGSNVKPRS